ncbi:MAG: phage tail protein [Rhodoblastus sp.]
MGGLFGERHQQSAANLPQYTGLQLNSATNALPVPLVYGMGKLPVNVVDYRNFLAIPELSVNRRAGKGSRGGGVQIVGWFYTADLTLAICEGPITNINQIWQGQSTYLFSAASPNPMGWTLPVYNFNCDLFLGTKTQGVWPHNAGKTWALEYSQTAYLAAAPFALGESASLGTLNVEVCGLLYGTGANGIDADPARMILDFLTDPDHGVGYSGAIDTGLLGAGDDSSLQTYCRALGLCLTAILNQFETASSILDRWLKCINAAAVRSGGVLKFIPYGDMDISNGAVAWRAPVAPVYDLDARHFLFSEGEEPVRVDRVDPATLPTVQRVEVLNRAGINVNAALVTQQLGEALAMMTNAASAGRAGSSYQLPQPNGQPQYQPTPVEWRDLTAIIDKGQRVAPTMTMHEICDLNVGATVAQIIGQRALYVRTHYRFRLDARFCLLDPMDVVTITTSRLTLKLVRIVEIEENDEGDLDILAEDLTIGVSTPGPNITMGALAGDNAATPASPVDAVLIYEPPLALTNGAAQLWLGASGGTAGVADPQWGGCIVHASVDGGVTYTQIARIAAPLAQGVTTGALADASGFDTVNTVGVDMAESAQALLSTTDPNAQAGVANLALIGSELIAFATATLTATNRYTLSRLQRGAFGSTHAAHAAGEAFAQLDNAAKIDLPPQYINAPVKFKFQSFNIYGEGLQDISACTPFDYTPSGSGLAGSTRMSTAHQALSPSGASAVTATMIPKANFLLQVTVTVTTAITGATGFNIDPVVRADGSSGGAAGEFGNCAAALGATHTFTTRSTLWSADSAIRLTAVGGSFTAGAVDVAVQRIAAG